MQDLQLISAWKITRLKDDYINYHTHQYYELVYYLSGNGITSIGDTAFSFTENSFAIIPAGMEHNETHYTDSEVICIEFSGTSDLQLSFFKDASFEISKTLKEMLVEVNKQAYAYREMLTVKLNELMLYIRRMVNNVGNTKNFEYIINYICENFHEQLNLSDCAKQLNLSYDYFQHKFKTLTGLSPRQYLLEQRLIASRKMLKSGEFNCTEIAYRCGFCTSAQFSAIFKKKYGLTPLQFKKKYV